MKILMLADNYVPEIAAPSFRTHEHVCEWIAQGHEVTVVTGVPNWPHGKTFPGYRNRLFQEERIDGVRVIRVWTYMAANRGFVKRTLDYLSFMFSATIASLRLPACDVVVATSPQFFTAVAGWLIGTLRRRPWVFEVRDLWPESIKAVGAGSGRLIRALERLELFLYRRARRVIVVTESFRHNLILRGIDSAKIDVVTNGVNCDRFSRARVTHDARRKLGIPSDVFLAGYIGTTGLAHGLESLLDAAEHLRQRRDIRLLIMGEGADRGRLEARARDRGLDNLCFADRVPQEQVAAYYAALDLAIVHLKPEPLFKSVIPSKIFELMAMEVPILLASPADGEAARIIDVAGCGVCIQSGDAAALADTVLKLAAEPQHLQTIGRRGRAVAFQRDSRQLKAREAFRALELAADFAVANMPTAPLKSAA